MDCICRCVFDCEAGQRGRASLGVGMQTVAPPTGCFCAHQFRCITSPRQGVSALGSGDVRGACRALRAATKLMPHDSDICKQFSHAVRPSCCGARGRPFTLSHANLPDEGGATQISRGGSNVCELPSVRNVLEGHPTGADLRVSTTRPPVWGCSSFVVSSSFQSFPSILNPLASANTRARRRAALRRACP